MWNAGLDKAQAGIKIAGRNISNLRYADDTTLIAESEEELKSLLIKVKEEEWKSRLKTQHSKNEDHGIQFHHFMANRWRNNGNSDRLYFFWLQNYCRWWLQPWKKRCLLLRRCLSSNVDSILKSRDITLATKVCLVKVMVFLVVMYGCESWTIKKDEHQRTDAFELQCWRRLESPLDCKEIKPVNPKGNQSCMFIGRTDADTEANTLATWWEELTH